MDTWSVSADWTFREKDYIVSCDEKDGVVVVQVEESRTADQWRGSFDVKHIEELTRKTGNFKSFAVFVNMLESAVLKSSSSVTLDLLTYSDLEKLRNQKLRSKSSPPTSSQLHSKRYLILTYSVEFDRIHYPLALPYVGKPDPVALQETIRTLQSELERWKKQPVQGSKTSLTRLQRRYDALLHEKEELEEAFESFRQEIMLTRDGTAAKETRLLKKVIRNLEQDLLTERSKHQKFASKKNQEIRSLLEEVEELRSAERTLRTRVKSLTNELAVLKRSLLLSPADGGGRNRLSRGGRKAVPSGSGERSDGSTTRQRSLSGERRRRGALPSDCVHAAAAGGGGGVRKIRTPSPAGTTRSRSTSADRSRPPRPLASTARRPRSRTLSAGSRSSCGSSINSRGSSRSRRSSNSDINSDGSQGIRTRRKQFWHSSNGNASTSTPVKKAINGSRQDANLMDHSAEMSEIDARLNALQQFMVRSLEANSRTHAHR